jgi:hypothetical protein
MLKLFQQNHFYIITDFALVNQKAYLYKNLIMRHKHRVFWNFCPLSGIIALKSIVSNFFDLFNSRPSSHFGGFGL